VDSFYSDKRRFSRHEVATLLRGQGALSELSQAEALAVVACMTPKRIREGTVLTRQGHHNPGVMLLILQGEAAVESEFTRKEDRLLLALLGSGSLIGELGVFDGEPRSATCTAATDMDVALLGKEQLSQLMTSQPDVAAKLLSVILARVSEKLRATNQKLSAVTMINRSMHEELDQAHRRLAEAQRASPAPAGAPAARGFEVRTPLAGALEPAAAPAEPLPPATPVSTGPVPASALWLPDLQPPAFARTVVMQAQPARPDSGTAPDFDHTRILPPAG
jgi:CRP-like cAMP-binding protein